LPHCGTCRADCGAAYSGQNRDWRRQVPAPRKLDTPAAGRCGAGIGGAWVATDRGDATGGVALDRDALALFRILVGGNVGGR
jgi:hypothetical protein